MLKNALSGQELNRRSRLPKLREVTIRCTSLHCLITKLLTVKKEEKQNGNPSGRQLSTVMQKHGVPLNTCIMFSKRGINYWQSGPPLGNRNVRVLFVSVKATVLIKSAKDAH